MQNGPQPCTTPHVGAQNAHLPCRALPVPSAHLLQHTARRNTAHSRARLSALGPKTHTQGHAKCAKWAPNSDVGMWEEGWWQGSAWEEGWQGSVRGGGAAGEA